MTISAKVIADSKNEFGNRITTMVVTMPRIILAEFNTHRMFSRNSASSRAIPFEKMVKSVEENPFIPIAWQKDHKGMQGTEYLDEEESWDARKRWISALEDAIRHATLLREDCGGGDLITKQLCNRLLEPFMWTTVIVTATEWENFFALRCPSYQGDIFDLKIGAIKKFFRSRKDAKKEFTYYNDLSEIEWLEINKGQAEIHMMALAEAMWDAYNESTPKELKAGEWHIPFGDNINANQFHKILKPLGIIENEDTENVSIIYTQELIDNLKIKIATACCARVSYTTFTKPLAIEDGGIIEAIDYSKYIDLHDRLAESGHWSPFEHCAKCVDTHFAQTKDGYTKGWYGNFHNWVQYRKTFQNENVI